MASPRNQHCASCIGTLSIPLFPPGPRVPTRGPGGNRGLLGPNPNSLLDPTNWTQPNLETDRNSVSVTAKRNGRITVSAET